MLDQILLSLIGGLAGAIIGALVGGYLSYKGAVVAAKKQIDYLYTQEKEKRNYEEQLQVKILKQALLAVFGNPKVYHPSKTVNRNCDHSPKKC